jgi:copper chaperone CopZ
VKEISFDLPAMYGDHHVTEVRRLLLELPGVQEVYASSSFHVVEVQFDETKLGSQKIEQTLSEAGYLGELPVPVEMSTLAERENGDKPFFRHTAVFENTGHTVSFGQQVPFAGRPLWPCPGMGPLTQNLDKS